MVSKQVPAPVQGNPDGSSESFTIPSLKGRNGRPILLSILPCWQKHVDNEGEIVQTLVMGALFMIILATFAEAVRYFRESMETSAVLVVARNNIDVRTKKVEPACDPEDKDCVRVVEEVVSPMKLKRCHWRHIINTVLYGIQCSLQLQCLLGVLSLNAPLIVSVLIGVLIGKLLFFWRPRQKSPKPIL